MVLVETEEEFNFLTEMLEEQLGGSVGDATWWTGGKDWSDIEEGAGWLWITINYDSKLVAIILFVCCSYKSLMLVGKIKCEGTNKMWREKNINSYIYFMHSFISHQRTF